MTESEYSMSALPRSIVSLSALADNARLAVAAARGSGSSVLCADLRRDAWGHGLKAVAQAVAMAGARRVIVDDDEAIDAIRDIELDAKVTVGERCASDINPAILYGLPDNEGVVIGTPAMALVGRVVSLKSIQTGDAVSYGYTFRAAKPTRLALVTGGYAQGIVRALGNQARVDISGKSFDIVGRIAMDVSVIDIGGVDVHEGAAVRFFGAGTARAALHDWQRITGLTHAELVTVAGLRTLREWAA